MIPHASTIDRREHQRRNSLRAERRMAAVCSANPTASVQSRKASRSARSGKSDDCNGLVVRTGVTRFCLSMWLPPPRGGGRTACTASMRGAGDSDSRRSKLSIPPEIPSRFPTSDGGSRCSEFRHGRSAMPTCIAWMIIPSGSRVQADSLPFRSWNPEPSTER